MPQVSVWKPTRTLAGEVAAKIATVKGRPVKKNEVFHLGLLLLAKLPVEQGGAGMDAAAIQKILGPAQDGRGDLPKVEP